MIKIRDTKYICGMKNAVYKIKVKLKCISTLLLNKR